MNQFIVKHYSEEPHPTIKGNGFDGLVIGNYREEAEDFIEFVNGLISIAQQMQAEIRAISDIIEVSESGLVTADFAELKRRLRELSDVQ